MLHFKQRHPEAKLPYRAHEGDAGYDLCSVEDCNIQPGQTIMVDTGLDYAFVTSYDGKLEEDGTTLVGMVAPRSGLAAKHGITVLNAPGIIDAGYTGPIKVIMHNTGDITFTVRKGDRIAQLLFVPVLLPEVAFTKEEARETSRAGNGYGSTGR